MHQCTQHFPHHITSHHVCERVSAEWGGTEYDIMWDNYVSSGNHCSLTQVTTLSLTICVSGSKLVLLWDMCSSDSLLSKNRCMRFDGNVICVFVYVCFCVWYTCVLLYSIWNEDCVWGMICCNYQCSIFSIFLQSKVLNQTLRTVLVHIFQLTFSAYKWTCSIERLMRIALTKYV